MTDFTKIVRFGTFKTYNDRSLSTYAEIKFKDGKLSICGVEGPYSNGNAYGSCGQCRDFEINELAPGWTDETLQTFRDVWNEWHLNDMKAGTPEQEAYLKAHEFPGYPVSHYDWASELLEKAGLNPDNGYKYGSAWLRQEVPDNVIDFLQSLPDTDKTPAWV